MAEPLPPGPPPDRPPLRTAAVPQGRGSRMLQLGLAVGGLAAGAAAEGVARLARGERPALADMVFAPGNARRLAERLSQMRGAAMKLGWRTMPRPR